MQRKATDEQLLTLWNEQRSASAISKITGLSLRNVQTRLRKIGVGPRVDNKVNAPEGSKELIRRAESRLSVDMTDGKIVVFSDAHFRSDAQSTANLALLKLLPEIKPKIIVCNGDAMDGETISRHAQIFLTGSRQTLAQEIKACTERMIEIAKVARGAKRIFTLGNHDIRLFSYLSANAPDLLDVHGLDIRHIFPDWEICWSLWVNDDTIIKHRWKSGQYAPANHVKGSLGMNFVTGHLHSLKVMPLSAYSHQPTRYGVDTGTLADPEWPQFAYREDSPADWRSGFVILTWRNGRLLWPEVVSVHSEGVIDYRGELLKI